MVRIRGRQQQSSRYTPHPQPARTENSGVAEYEYPKQGPRRVACVVCAVARCGLGSLLAQERTNQSTSQCRRNSSVENRYSKYL